MGKYVAVIFGLTLIPINLVSHAIARVEWNFPEEDKSFRDYEKALTQLHRKVCRPGTIEQFHKLNTAYRAGGFYLPLTTSGKIDLDAINKYLPILKKKIHWIDSLPTEITKITQRKNKILNFHKEFMEIINRILHANHQLNLVRDNNQKSLLIERRDSDYHRLKMKFENYLSLLTYLKAFDFPVDYHQLRKDFDQYQKGDTPSAKNRANSVFMYRKIVEDGAMNLDQSGSDLNLRALMSTLYIRFQKNNYLAEDMRYDLEDFMVMVEKNLNYKPSELLARNDEWKNRTNLVLNFYQARLSKHEKDLNISKEFLEQKNTATQALIDWNTQKQSDIYTFWKQKPIWMQGMYALERILTLEAGDIDGANALEREAIAQVYINRLKIPHYSRLKVSQPLSKSIAQDDESIYLSTLFREGEFSFTYHFIPSSHHLYCPDESGRGKKIRNTNTQLAYQFLKKYLVNGQKTFAGLRYFSRVGMVGRIHIHDMWDQYHPIPMEPGLRIAQQMKRKDVKRVLYRFQNTDRLPFQVIENHQGVWVQSLSSKQYYTYRSPHYFTYFRPVKKLDGK